MSVASDMPTPTGCEPDRPRAPGEVAGQGVGVDSLAALRALVARTLLGEVSASTTITRSAAVLLVFVGVRARLREISGSLRRVVRTWREAPAF